MAQYHSNDELEIKKVADSFELKTYEVEQVQEDTEIESTTGKVLVTPPNYIITSPDGTKAGIAESDLHARFTEAKKR